MKSESGFSLAIASQPFTDKQLIFTLHKTPTIILFLSSLLTALFSHYNAKNARMTCSRETKRAT